MAVVGSFSKVCAFSENDPIRLHNNYHCVFKSLHFGDHFQKLSFSVKTIIVFDCFRVRCKVKTHRKVCGFDENDMKTYSCRPEASC